MKISYILFCSMIFSYYICNIIFSKDMKKERTMAYELKKRYSLTSIAKKFNTDLAYVSQIATGKRVPIRGKGLEIKKELEQLVK